MARFATRTAHGIWARFDPMKLATPEAFARDPDTVLAFYDLRRRNLLNAKPNAAHRALARLEQALAERGGHLTLVTQNIDDLHERAGSRRVIHMHGELLKARCQHCGSRRACGAEDLSPSDVCPDCAPRRRASSACRLVRRNADASWATSTGRCARPISSSQSAPRAPSIRRRASSPRRAATDCGPCEINLEAADNAELFDEERLGPASETVPAWVDELLGA